MAACSVSVSSDLASNDSALLRGRRYGTGGVPWV
jgi:hypothetical protein